MSRSVPLILLFVSTLLLATPAISQPRIGGGGGGAGGGGSASAGDQVLSRVTLEDMKTAFIAANFKNVQIAPNGKVVTGELDGMTIGVVPVPVGSPQPDALQFLVAFGRQPDMDPRWIASWNALWMFARFYTNPQGELFAEMDHLVKGGTTRQNLVSASATFGKMVKTSLTWKPGDK